MVFALNVSVSVFFWAENGQDRELDCLGARKAMTRKPEALKGKNSLRQVIRLEKRQRCKSYRTWKS